MDALLQYKEPFMAFLEYIFTPSPTVFITGALIVLLFPVLFHYALVSSSPYTSPPTVLLVGSPAAGKTSLVALLERDSEAGPAGDQQQQQQQQQRPQSPVPQTHTSQAAHSTLARLAPDAIAESKTKAVVFLVDAAALAEHDALSAAASYLYDVLLLLQKRTAGIKTSKIPSAVPLLVAVNKLDLFTALPPALVKASLEAEISRIRVSKSKGLLDSGVGTDDIGSEETDDWLGSYGTEKFTFDQMREFNVYVDVEGGNVLGDGPGVGKWWAWIADKV
ncbi:unnamed protein product [Parascedosporium putredinis]|uniref:Signal recognition particle receptor subunit beta n=1 Tax=Parascedosporium putredinis TaxID=1442378 RepID=A0A9P1H7W6_9PEZI|nr:unnamed protein product [Parascedosporium putredinis]CAI8000116.1 unnamed protein product [Parascedosporium putredinis]